MIYIYCLAYDIAINLQHKITTKHDKNQGITYPPRVF